MRDRDLEAEYIELEQTIFAIIIRYELEAANKTSLLPNVFDMLKTLQTMNIRMAVFTTNSEQATNQILCRFNLREFFQVVITRDSVQAVKPDPVHLKTVLDALKINPKQAMVVGDSERDIRCAKSLNVLAVGITTGIASQETLIQAGADHLASSAEDIPILVENLNSLNGECQKNS